jgi:hypothetical protein
MLLVGMLQQPFSSKPQKVSSSGNYPSAPPLSRPNFRERIKKWRLEQGLFQVDLAKMTGVSDNDRSQLGEG